MNKSLNRIVKLKIGTIVIKIESEYNPIINKLLKDYSDFISNEKPELNILIKKDSKERNEKNTLYYDTNKKILLLKNSLIKARYFTEKALVIIEISTKSKDEHSDFRHALRHMLSYYVIQKNKGLVLHASGIVKGNTSIVFSGNSGRGKTFLVKYFQGLKKFTVMNDECVLLQPAGNKIYSYSTIFSGKTEVKPKNSKGELKKLFFLEWSNKNNTEKLEPMVCFKKLLCDSLFIDFIIGHKSLMQNSTFLKNYFGIAKKISKNIRVFDLNRDVKDPRLHLNKILEN